MFSNDLREHFIEDNLLSKIVIENRALADGTEVPCYIIQSKSTPSEHRMGPWSPRTVTDSAGKGGKWFHQGQLYDVDGPFVKNAAAFFKDPEAEAEGKGKSGKGPRPQE